MRMNGDDLDVYGCAERCGGGTTTKEAGSIKYESGGHVEWQSSSGTVADCNHRGRSPSDGNTIVVDTQLCGHLS